jgi:hypothetical protein
MEFEDEEAESTTMSLQASGDFDETATKDILYLGGAFPLQQ